MPRPAGTGPASQVDRMVYLELKKKKVKRMPKEYRNELAYATPKDPIGKIQVYRMSGLAASPAVAVVKKFEELVGEREAIIEKLSAVGDRLTEPERKLLELLIGQAEGSIDGRKTLARLLAEAGVSVSRVLTRYAEGALALGRVEAAIEVSRNQPTIVRDLIRNALDDETICATCGGTGEVNRDAGLRRPGKRSQNCPQCKGTGRQFLPKDADIKKFSMEKVLQIGKTIEKEPKGPAVAVQMNQQVSVGGGGAFMEKVLKTSDQILYGRRAESVATAPVVEAVVVETNGVVHDSEGEDLEVPEHQPSST